MRDFTDTRDHETPDELWLLQHPAIYTLGQYQLTGELFFHGRAAGDPRPVRDVGQAIRYEFIPATERLPRLFPAVLVVPSGRAPGATVRGDHFTGSRLLGTLLFGR